MPARGTGYLRPIIEKFLNPLEVLSTHQRLMYTFEPQRLLVFGGMRAHSKDKVPHVDWVSEYAVDTLGTPSLAGIGQYALFVQDVGDLLASFAREVQREDALDDRGVHLIRDELLAFNASVFHGNRCVANGRTPMGVKAMLGELADPPADVLGQIVRVELRQVFERAGDEPPLRGVVE